MKKQFLLYFLNGFITTILTFIIIEFVVLPELFFNLQKILIFIGITLLIGFIIFRKQPISSYIATLIGGAIASFLIFNYATFITDFFANTVLGGTLVGIFGTTFKFLIELFASLI